MAQVAPMIAQAVIASPIGADAAADGPRSSSKSVAWAIPEQPQVKINRGDDANAATLHVGWKSEGRSECSGEAEPKLSMDLDGLEDLLRTSSGDTGFTGAESISVGKTKTQSHALTVGTQSCAITAVATKSRNSVNSGFARPEEAKRIFTRSKSEISNAFGIEEAPLVDKMSSTRTLPPSARIARLRKFLESKGWTALSMAGLFFALFGGAIFIISDFPDDPGTVLQDTIMCIVTVFFIVELVLLSMAGRGYRYSFFFWMDILGTISMVFEISFLLGTAGRVRVEAQEVNPVLLRSARAAKVGARAARLSKVLKCFTFNTRRNAKKQADNAVTGGKKKKVAEYDAQILKQRLNLSLSSKVSMLTVLLVIVTPMFNIGRYPEEDFSMKGWVRTLELDYHRAWTMLEVNSNLTTTPFFTTTVRSMKEFFTDTNYFPYSISGYEEQVAVNGRQVFIKGASLLPGGEPNRKQNIVQQQVKSCLTVRKGCSGSVKAWIYFDFYLPNIYEAALDSMAIIFIVCVMILEAYDLSRSVDRMVVRPVEKMLGTVQMMANILCAVRPGSVDAAMAKGYDEEEFVDPFAGAEGVSEAQMLELVFTKFSMLVSKFLAQSMAEELELEMQATDDVSRGVLLELMGLGETQETQLASAGIVVESSTGKVVPDLPVEEEILDTWNLDIWRMSVEDQTKCVRYYFFDHQESTGRIWCEVPTFFKFQELVRIQYVETNPYHNYTHACDVVASVFRVFRRLRCTEWLSDIDMYALLVSALCHDVGHPGWTTPFLVETRHELAVRYNDSSPLENMHCARLFEICGHEDANAFQKFEKDAFKQARKVCINSILHTDNSMHFEMVRSVKEAYDLTSDICDGQALDADWFNEAYINEVLYKFTPLWHQLILHMSDVANPLKPWSISRLLATRVQDEFFNQGDEEMKLGIPVGMLNDREKVNRSGAEHGFINFLVSPLVLATVSNFPYLHHMAIQMVDNLKEWRNLWVQDTKPSQEDTAKRDADIKKIQEQVDKLAKRKPISTLRNEQRHSERKHSPAYVSS